MTLGYLASDMVLGSKVNVRVRVNSNTAWVRMIELTLSALLCDRLIVMMIRPDAGLVTGTACGPR